MRFQIVVAPHPPEAEPPAPGPRRAGDPGLYVVRRAHGAAGSHDLVDVFVDGANVTARVRETHGVFVLRDLALALVELARRPRGKAAVRFYDEPWELCIERFGASACVSVYRTGADPLVTLYDRAVPLAEVVEAVRGAVERVLATGEPVAGSRLELASAAERLRGLTSLAAPHDARVPEPVQVVVEPDRDAPLSFGAEFTMRDGPPAPEDADAELVERADLHALLFRGRVRADVRGRALDLGDCHPLLVAERLVEIARRAFDAWERGLALHARGESAGVLVGVRVGAGGELALTLGGARAGAGGERAVYTFPALGAADLLHAALAFGRALVRAVLRHDRSQSSNLRLRPFRRALREGSEALREASQSDSKVNETPEPYRAFADALDGAPRPRRSAPPAARLRYTARWRAVVPGIDLRSTYLCGDRLVVGSPTEMWALDRADGRVLWRSDVLRGTSVMTPDGVARLAPDGTMCIYDLATGEAALRMRISPRAGGPMAGAVVHLPGLPRLLIVTEGEHHLVAIDLASGEPRWRWSWRGPRARRRGPGGVPRIKRAGRLVYFTCGDGALTALDVMTGAVVWRVRDRLRFRAPPAVTHDALFAVAGGTHGLARLHCIDPYSGRTRWSTDIAGAGAPCTIEGTPMVASRSVALAVRQSAGLELAAFERDGGAPLSGRARVMAPSGTSWLAVDDAFVGNAPTGELVAVDAHSGELRWRQVLGPPPLEADVPRRLEPVLRCGALFVPHAEVVVVRPHDGAIIGAISPTEAIPDLLRVDERCDVYIAEESGHLIAFGALPRLSVVEPVSPATT
ncbi:MAG TPA: PQQ-binding-like beta-propeller repeat protein [Polyangiaceae bacterium]|nr:PQQ-binding-like beta-propeller repeat protein [Polyangiaceae bacterium]